MANDFIGEHISGPIIILVILSAYALTLVDKWFQLKHAESRRLEALKNQQSQHSCDTTSPHLGAINHDSVATRAAPVLRHEVIRSQEFPKTSSTVAPSAPPRSLPIISA